MGGDVPPQAELGLDERARETGRVDCDGCAEFHIQYGRGARNAVVDAFVGEVLEGGEAGF